MKLIPVLFAIVAVFLSPMAVGEACEGNDRVRSLLACATDMHLIFSNRQAEERQQALNTIFQGVQPGIRWNQISCPGNWVASDGRGNSLESAQRSLYTFPVIRSGNQGGGYLLYDIQRDSNGCFQARQTTYVEPGNATGPVSIPFREQRCRVSASTAGAEFQTMQMSLPIERYLGDTAETAGRNVSASSISYTRENESPGQVETRGPVSASSEGIQNLIIAELRSSLSRLEESVLSDSESNRAFWSNSANLRQLNQLLSRCEMSRDRESFGANTTALEFFTAVDELRTSYSAMLTPGGAASSGTTTTGDGGTKDGTN